MLRVRLVARRQTLNLSSGVRFSHPLPNQRRRRHLRVIIANVSRNVHHATITQSARRIMLGYSSGKRLDCESSY